jgi:hypothetical protein
MDGPEQVARKCLAIGEVRSLFALSLLDVLGEVEQRNVAQLHAGQLRKVLIREDKFTIDILGSNGDRILIGNYAMSVRYWSS